jgi:hypothetical protein
VDLPAYVRRADADIVEVDAGDGEMIGRLTQLGFEPDADRAGSFVLPVDDDEEKADVFAAFRDAGVCFSWGREWSPVEVFQLLCESGLLEGPFRAIGWRGPDDFVLREMR